MAFWDEGCLVEDDFARGVYVGIRKLVNRLGTTKHRILGFVLLPLGTPNNNH